MPKPTKKESDLRTTPVALDVAKVTNLHGLREQALTHWNLRTLQPYFPPMEAMFKLEHVRMPLQYGLKVRTPVQTIASPDKIFAGNVEVPIHRKTTMLLSPFMWMRGDFGTASGMPLDRESAEEIHERLQSIHNAAYVGALACAALSESGCIHFPHVYGTFTAIANEYMYDISNDYEELCERPWFLQNLGHTFDLRLKESLRTRDLPALTIEATDDVIDLGVQEIDAPAAPVSTPMPESDDLVPELEEDDESESDGASTDYVFKIRSCSSGGSDVGVDGEDEEPYAHAVFHDVQVQTTLMERCEGTLFQLFKDEPSTEKRMAWLAQIVFALAYAQRNYGFVHNDLHVYNVMWIPTDKESLYYNLAGACFQVPTYGKIMKIIDFDRATFSLRLPGMRESRLFMSDQFDVNEEAGGQYNTEPFYTSKYPEVKPNPSFDLVRLAACLFWDCYPEGPFADPDRADPLYQTLMAWLTLPDGKSILFRNLAEKDAHDRYHGFHLYKAIARYCKDTAVPRKQGERFSMFRVERIPPGQHHLFIEP
jgi:hypothetical protein